MCPLNQIKRKHTNFVSRLLPPSSSRVRGRKVYVCVYVSIQNLISSWDGSRWPKIYYFFYKRRTKRVINERGIYQSINWAYTCIILCLLVSPFREMDDGTRPPKTSRMSCAGILQNVPSSLCKPTMFITQI